MGKSHVISGYVSQFDVLNRGAFDEIKADLVAEQDFLRDIVNFSPLDGMRSGLRRFFSPGFFQVEAGWCTAPRLQSGYEGPAWLIGTSLDQRCYILTRENDTGDLCLQAGDCARDKIIQRDISGPLICFGALPHMTSGNPVAVMTAMVADMRKHLDNYPAMTEKARLAWGQLICDYLNAKQTARLVAQQGHPMARHAFCPA